MTPCPYCHSGPFERIATTMDDTGARTEEYHCWNPRCGFTAHIKDGAVVSLTSPTPPPLPDDSPDEPDDPEAPSLPADAPPPYEPPPLDLQTLTGTTLNFYGVDMNKFKIGPFILEAIEDESDGYRSMLDEVAVRETGQFFPQPIAQVEVVAVDDTAVGAYDLFDGWVLRDVTDGHIWLYVGTDTRDDYYPCFVFEYQAKPPPTEEHPCPPTTASTATTATDAPAPA